MAGIALSTPSITAPFKENSGGLNSTAAALKLQINESSDLQNIDFDIFGSIKKRNGYAALNTTAIATSPTITSLHFYIKSDGTEKFIATAGAKVWRMNDLDGTWNDITAALTITAGVKWKWETFLDTAYGTNGTDLPITVTDSGNAAAAAVPTNLTDAKWVKLFSSYMFLGNVIVSGTAHPTRVYWSNINSITSWTATDFNDVSRNDGQPITGLEVLGDRLVIFKSGSIHVATFTGDTNIPFVFQKTNSHVGAISGYSIVNVENGLAFASNDGFYFFDGNNSYKISDRINTTYLGLNTGTLDDISGSYLSTRNRVYWSTCDGAATTTNQIITWDTSNNAFSLYTGMAANYFESFITGGGERIYFGDYSGFVYRADTTTNDAPLNVSTAINAYYYTKWFDYDELVLQKATPQVVLYYQLNTAVLTFAYSFDLNSSDEYTQTITTTTVGSLWNSGIWGQAMWGGNGGKFARIDLLGRGRLIRLKFANANLSETFQIDGFGNLVYADTNV